jgi:hypothetical protein
VNFFVLARMKQTFSSKQRTMNHRCQRVYTKIIDILKTDAI